jgi:hypothetical protein
MVLVKRAGSNFLVGCALSVSAAHAFAGVAFQNVKHRGDLSTISVAINFDQEDLKLSATTQGYKLNMEQLNPVGVEGAPDVLATGRLIAVPEGYRAEIAVKNIESKEIPGVVLSPYEKKYRCHNAATEKALEFTPNLYKTSGTFPSNWIQLESVGQMQGVTLQRIAVYPTRQNFSNGSLKYLEKMDAEVRFVKIDSSKAGSKQVVSPTMAKLFAGSVLNAEDAIRRSTSDSLIVISGDQFKDNIKPLVDWKMQHGVNVTVMTTTEAGGTKEAIAAKIKSIYNASEVKPTAVLLVGGGKAVPAFKQKTSSGNASTDYPYTLLAGDDVVPDILMGRIVADNAAEVKTYVEKSLATESGLDAPNDWTLNAMTLASNEGSNPSDADYAKMVEDQLTGHGYSKVDRFYQASGSSTEANILAALEEGRSYMAYFGHGSGTTWGSTNTSFGVSQIQKTKNVGKLPVLVDVACLNGGFETYPNCFGKAWMTQRYNDQPAGLAAYYGGSVSVSWDPPAVMSVGVIKSHFEKNIASVGGSVLGGQLYLLEQMGVKPSTIENMVWYNLFGDPLMTLRTNNP